MSSYDLKNANDLDSLFHQNTIFIVNICKSNSTAQSIAWKNYNIPRMKSIEPCFVMNRGRDICFSVGKKPHCVLNEIRLPNCEDDFSFGHGLFYINNRD